VILQCSKSNFQTIEFSIILKLRFKLDISNIELLNNYQNLWKADVIMNTLEINFKKLQLK
jgi:hypothetical protein